MHSYINNVNSEKHSLTEKYQAREGIKSRQNNSPFQTLNTVYRNVLKSLLCFR